MEFFNFVDKDGDGYLTKDELHDSIENLNSWDKDPKPWHLEILEMCLDFGDKNGDGVVDFDEFVQIVVVSQPFTEKYKGPIKFGLVFFYFFLGCVVYINEDFVPDNCDYFQPLYYTDPATSVVYEQSSGLPSCTRDWTVTEALYFGAVTVSTVGYGDFGPHTDEMKIFTVIYILYGLGVVGSILADFAGQIIDSQQEAMMKKLDDDPDDGESPHGWKIALSFMGILVMVLIGTLFFSLNEDWTFVDAFYWSFVTCTTVGYGDLSLTKDGSRLFSFFYILTATMVVAAAIGNLASVSLEIRMEKKRKALLSRKLDMSMLADMDKDGDGVDAGEFLAAMLVHMELVTEDDCNRILQRFYELDEDGSGKLDSDDLAKLKPSVKNEGNNKLRPEDVVIEPIA